MGTAVGSQPPPGRVPGGDKTGDPQLAAALVEGIAAAVVSVVVAVVGVVAASSVLWPAFTTSHVLRALTTFGQFSAIAVLCMAVALMRTRTTVWGRWMARVLSWIGLSGFVTITIGMPLAATSLYLSGLSPDQQLRSQLLGRFADSPLWRDGTYTGLPSDQAVGWYWLGGQAAAVAGLPGWEALKLYAITSIAAAAVLALVWWSRMVRGDISIVLAVVTTAVAIAYAASDPAFTICLLLFTPAVAAAWSGVRDSAGRPGAAGFTRRPNSPSEAWARLVGVAAYLALCAAFDKASFLIAAGAVTAVALLALAIPNYRTAVAEGQSWRRGVLGRWLAMASAAAVTAALVWGPYLWQRGIAALIEIEVPAGDWGATVRVVLAAIGVLVVIAAIRAISPMLSKPRVLRRVAAAVGVLAMISFSQQIPDVLEVPIGVAYSDTGGQTEGKKPRADGYWPSAVAEYPRVDEAITAATGQLRRDTVVLTGDTTLLAIYPYTGFLAQSARYSNPLADYDSRVRQLRGWTALRSPDELIAALDHSPRPAPAVFVFRRSGEHYQLRLANDPRSDNGLTRTYTTLLFPVPLFDAANFTHVEVGPFTVLVRH
ncbi:arabinofuranosyltransferase [Nocardia sp. R6R-6]|uniref:arabinofuranosyltransferase n=1 Tax=Nocardia sp. R6R-6 TaxID=3459303 RepID=UPI00403D8136